MPDIQHRTVKANGLSMHIAECGAGHGVGKVVLLCHGFPETWYSWRHQLRALGTGGFFAVAPDMRGYGRTGSPPLVERFTLLDLVGDMVGLLDSLGAPDAVIVGHDWGAPVAWHAALLRPDRFRGVIALSVPFRPPPPPPPTTRMPQDEARQFYQLHFQAEGVAEAEFDPAPRRVLRGMLYAASGDAPPGGDIGMVPRAAGMLALLPDPPALPPWISEADVDAYAADFAATGFRGGLNWYRNIDRNWALLAPFAGLKVRCPALYIAGERDLVVNFRGAREAIAAMPALVPDLRGSILLPGCGHWTQQERAPEVNAAILGFLRDL